MTGYGAVGPGIICTHSGVRFDVTNPEDRDIRVEDIAWGLAHKLRFGGHCSPPYSVAQHSYHVAGLCIAESPIVQLAAILHDAAEAYLADVPSPIKMILPDYTRLEQDLQGRIFQRFGIPKGWALSPPEAIKLADRTAYMIERAHIMPAVDWWPSEHLKDCGYNLYSFSTEGAYKIWMEKFEELQANLKYPSSHEL